jgi:hypothetical protein
VIFLPSERYYEGMNNRNIAVKTPASNDPTHCRKHIFDQSITVEAPRVADEGRALPTATAMFKDEVRTGSAGNTSSYVGPTPPEEFDIGASRLVRFRAGLGALHRTSMVRESGQLRKLDVNTLGFEIGKECLRDNRKPLARRVNDVPVAPDGQSFDIQSNQ